MRGSSEQGGKKQLGREAGNSQARILSGSMGDEIWMAGKDARDKELGSKVGNNGVR